MLIKGHASTVLARSPHYQRSFCPVYGNNHYFCREILAVVPLRNVRGPRDTLPAAVHPACGMCFGLISVSPASCYGLYLSFLFFFVLCSVLRSSFVRCSVFLSTDVLFLLIQPVPLTTCFCFVEILIKWSLWAQPLPVTPGLCIWYPIPAVV